MAQYSAVNAAANQTAQTPFSQYGGQFVAPVNAQQSQGIAGTNAAATEAQPYYGAATSEIFGAQAGTQPYNSAATETTGAAANTIANAYAGTQPNNTAAQGTLGAAQANTQPYNAAAAAGTAASASPLTGSQIESYLSPYLGTVLGSESALLNQNNQQQQAGQLGTAISSGAFGGDRTGIAAANLEQQQNLANSNIYGNILNTGYQSALGTAQGQQQIGLAGSQQLANIGQQAYGEGANTAAQYASQGQTAYGEGAQTSAQQAALGQQYAGLGQTAYGESANTATTLAGLGSGAQTAGLQGAQAQIGAGTLQQQTQQAQDTAQYNQFEQQQSYPFQVDQFLANIAEGTGALSGSTTTTSQPGGFFSDEHLKHNKRPIGKTFDGQTLYSYQMHGDPRTHVGLMAQEVEKKHPEAVGLAAGYKTVDYGQATKEAANQGHFNAGGVVPLRAKRAAGGGTDLDAILAAQQQMYAGLGGGNPRATTGAPHGGMARVPAPSGGSPQLVTAQGGLRAQPTGAQNVASAGQFYKNIGSPDLSKVPSKVEGWFPGSTTTTTTPGGLSPGIENAQANPSVMATDQTGGPALSNLSIDAPANYTSAPVDQKRGGRIGLAAGGDTPYSDSGGLDIPDENAHNQLSKPGQLPPPSPTGFQQLMSMGSSMGGGGGGMGGMVSGIFGGGSSGMDASTLFDSGSTAGDAYTALAAAQRGGRIKRDTGGGFDADSAPNSGGLGDAPDTSLDQAPALKQGAPNQSMNWMGDAVKYAKDAYAAYGAYGMLAAAAAKRGGRIGKDDGGSISDPDMMPEATVTGVRPDPITYTGGVGLEPPASAAGVATAPSDAAIPADEPTKGVAPPPDAPAPVPKKDSGTPIWDTIKGELSKPSNIIPILAGIGAMGTAPTRSLGTAMAAGLSGAAANYVPTQEGLAHTGLVQQQARSAGYQADLQQAANNYALPMMNGTAKPSPTISPVTAPQSPTPSQPTSLPDQLRAKYQNPPLTAQEAQDVQRGNYLSAATKNPQWAEAAKVAPHQRVVQADYQNKQDAQSNYDAAVSTYRATKDTNPTMAASAAATADAYQQYTGDAPMTGAGGVQLNGRTKEPYIGSQAQRLAPDAYTQLNSQMMQMDTVPAGDASDPNKTIQMRHYRHLGFNTPAEAIASVVPAGIPDVPGQGGAPARQAQGSAPQGAPTVPQRAVPQRPIAPVSRGQSVPQAQPAAALPTRPGQSASAAAAAPPSILPNPVAAKAFSDPKFFPPTQPNQPGTTFGSATGINADAEAKRKVELQAVASDISEASGAALQYADAAKKILDSKGAPVTGFFGPFAKTISSIAGTADASNYEKVSKQLINLAVQAGKSNFPNATQKEVGIQLEQASPSAAQQGPALRSLLDETININQYALDSATLANDYVDKGGIALRFGGWNQTYHPRADAVNTGTTAAPGTQEGATSVAKGGRPIMFSNGHWQYKKQ